MLANTGFMVLKGLKLPQSNLLSAAIQFFILAGMEELPEGLQHITRINGILFVKSEGNVLGGSGL